FDAFDLGVQLAGVAGPDVGLQDETDAGGALACRVDGALDDGHDLVPFAFDLREHGAGAVGQARFAYDADGPCDGFAHSPVGLAVGGSGRTHAERDDHGRSPCGRGAWPLDSQFDVRWMWVGC